MNFFLKKIGLQYFKIIGFFSLKTVKLFLELVLGLAQWRRNNRL